MGSALHAKRMPRVTFEENAVGATSCPEPEFRSHFSQLCFAKFGQRFSEIPRNLGAVNPNFVANEIWGRFKRNSGSGQLALPGNVSRDCAGGYVAMTMRCETLAATATQHWLRCERRRRVAIHRGRVWRAQKCSAGSVSANSLCFCCAKLLACVTTSMFLAPVDTGRKW